MTNREIADRLFLSTHTVITHRRNIARKLQIHSASGLTIYAIVNKLVELGALNSNRIFISKLKGMWISDKSAFRIPFTINIIKFNDHILLTLIEN